MDSSSSSVKNEKVTRKRSVPFEAHVHGVNLSVYNLDPEKILSQFGTLGTYQMIIYGMASFAFFLYAGETMVMSLIAEDPSFDCVLDSSFNDNSSTVYEIVDQCYIQEIDSNNTHECGQFPNTHFHFNGSKHASLASEFDLVCSEKYWSQHGMSLFMIGNMFSTPLVSQFSDRFGRRLTFLLPLWLSVLSNIGCSLAPYYWLFLIFRFLAGIGTAGLSTIGFVIMLECVSPSFRSHTPIVLNLVWIAGYMAVGVVHLVFRDNWRYLYFAISAPGLISFGFYWLMPETLHWMITHKKNTGISKYIEQSTKWSGVDVEIQACRASISDDDANERKDKASKRTFLDIFKSKPFMFHLFLHCYIMIVMNFTYWALSLFSVDLHENKMVGYFLSGVVELPALVGIVLLYYFGRRTVTFMALFAQGLSMIGAIFSPEKSTMRMSMSLLGKVFNNVAWMSAPLLQGEMAPTSMRNMFYGVIGFKEYNKNAPFIVIAGMSFLGAAAALCSPETKDKPMPEDLDQINPGFVYNYLFTNKKRSMHQNSIDCKTNDRQHEANKLIKDVDHHYINKSNPPVINIEPVL